MQPWVRSTNIYEVNLRQYSPEGTLQAFATHLPRLKDMGVDTLWFMPLTPISQQERKGSMGSYYACADYTSVALEFGTLDDFKTLVYQAHRMGMKVILDWVANHTGWDHWWTVEHPDWYERDEHGGFKKASGMDDIIELDFKNPHLRKAMMEAMKFWVTETDIDGFRCDLAFWVELDFWVEAKPQLEAVKPLFWLGELDPLEHPDYMQVFDAAYPWSWMHTAERFCKGEASFDELRQVVERYQQAPGLQAWFTANHDENSWNGTEYEKYGQRALPLAVFAATWRGLPLVYSGQELPNHKRLQFFEKDPIQWRPDIELHNFYKTLFAARKAHAALEADAAVELLSANASQEVFVFRRWSGASQVVVALSLSLQAQQVQVAVQDGQWVEQFSGRTADGLSSFSLPACGYQLWTS